MATVRFNFLIYSFLLVYLSYISRKASLNCFDEDAAYENYDVGEFEPIDRMEKERAEQYVGKFMANAGFTARYGRHVGISEDIHERVTKFVSIVGKGKISIASYVDNIINEHFNAYAAEIKAAFDEGLKSYRL